MPKSFADLTLDEAFKILDSRNVQDLSHHFSPADIQHLLAETIPVRNYKSESPSVSESLITVLTKEPTLPSMMIWSIVGSVTLAITSLAIITVVTLGMLSMAGLIYSVLTYLHLRKKQIERDRFFQLAMLKSNCADLIYRHYNHELSQVANLNLAPSLSQSYLNTEYHYENEKRPKFLLKAVGMGVLVSTTLFGTYYIGTSATLLALGFAGAFAFLAGPIPIAVGIAIALCVGLYFGYSHYKHSRRQNEFQKLRDEVNYELTSKHRKCHELQIMDNILKAKNPIKAETQVVPTRKHGQAIPMHKSHEVLFHHDTPVKQALIPPAPVYSERPGL